MAAELVHAPKGVVIGIILARVLSTSLGWLTIPVVLVVTFLSHLVWDKLSHSDAIHAASEEEFEAARAADPKATIKALVKEGGLKVIFGRNARTEMAKQHKHIAYPPALTIPKVSMLVAFIDVGLAGLLTLILAILTWLLHPNALAVTCVMFGAFGAVLPDLLLPAPIYRRLIKYDWFWRLDMFHHWIHAHIIQYKNRWWGFISQLLLAAGFTWLAWSLIPRP